MPTGFNPNQFFFYTPITYYVPILCMAHIGISIIKYKYFKYFKISIFSFIVLNILINTNNLKLILLKNKLIALYGV